MTSAITIQDLDEEQGNQQGAVEFKRGAFGKQSNYTQQFD